MIILGGGHEAALSEPSANLLLLDPATLVFETARDSAATSFGLRARTFDRGSEALADRCEL
jgi:hypothetical protein